MENYTTLLALAASPCDLTLAQRQQANRVARAAHYGRATAIILGTCNRVCYHTAYGYRKCTTGEYVPRAYRANFGWKNTYYQWAETIVEIQVSAPVPQEAL